LPFRIAVYLFGERLEMQSVVQMKEAFHQQPTHLPPLFEAQIGAPAVEA
jgi:hypothetical protein